ncbi:MAG TPA: endonuclease domain-containing protein [Chloroflexota bacterium]|nr:endonuclease domain-containing protein [Chloroflexota bacterium]
MRQVTKGQPVNDSLRERARTLRQEMTKAELVLWDQLRHHRLDNAHFRRQQVISGFIVDFYCSAAGLVVEVDGLVHQAQSERDRDRDQILRAMNLRVVRFTNDEVLGNPLDVLSRIAELLSLTSTDHRE